jgi:hypothetical protein
LGVDKFAIAADFNLFLPALFATIFLYSMSIFLEPNLYVRIIELENGPAPLPLASGFNTNRAYRVLGLYTASETGEAYLILPNDREEMWFISNRHVRIKGILPETTLHVDFQNETN